MAHITSKTIIVAVIMLGLTVVSCSRSTPPAAEDEAPAIGHPSSTDSGGVGDVAAPAPVESTTPYEGTVAEKTTESSVEFDMIVSKYPCTTEKDCASTKYKNVPKSGDDCTCAAACTPYVVNKKEKKLREDANKRFCKTTEWYGPHCPAPDCSFMEFDMFKCKDKVCQAEAVGKR